MRKPNAKWYQVVCLVVAVAVVLSVRVPAVHSAGPELGGTFKTTGPISYFSPCNASNVAGTVNATASVHVVGGENGQVLVFVSVVYDAPNQTDTAHNTYNAHGQAFATYSALASGGSYVLPMNLDYDSTNNNTLSFLAGTDAVVEVDSNQRPTNVPDIGRNAVCGK
jgi:hypothetical protein